MKIRTKLNIGFFITAFLPFIAMTIFTIFYYDYKLEQIIREKSIMEINTATPLFQQNIEKILVLTFCVETGFNLK